MRWLGDLAEGGDEIWLYMDQPGLKLQNLPKQLRLLADSPPTTGRRSIANLMGEASVTDQLPVMMLDTMRTNRGLK